jgi:hypothetical protein
LFLASPAPAQQMADPPPPAATDEASIQDWIRRYLEIDGWIVVGADDQAVSLRRAEPVGRTANGLPHTEVRHEYFRPVDFGGQQVRSILQVVVVECEHTSQYVAAMTIFQHNNLHQNYGFRAFSTVTWSAAQPGTLKARTIDAICAAAQASPDQR